jgi:ParB family transcriptional regulator, chromosome partitioning protein
MSAVEEHKPVEKRRALGRGLDSLLPAGPPVVPAVSVASAGPVAIPAPAVVPPQAPPVPGEIAEINAAREKSDTHGHATGGTTATAARAGAPAPHTQARTGMSEPHGQGIFEIPLDLIGENPYQTRRTFDAAALNELAESIKESGLAQPVVVRPGENGRYVLVLGERRCRASKLAGKTTVSAIVRRLGDEQAAEMTIVENLQRQDLNCLEQAQAFARLSREFNLTQEQIGKRTGSSRESVANYMRLLKLPKGVLNLVGEGKLGFSEARVLLEALPYLDEAGIEQMARDAIQYEWTVKELQGRLSALRDFGAPGATKEPPAPKPVDPNVKAAESELQRLLGMRVRITDRKGKGTIVIQYQTVEDFDRLLDVLRER